MESGFWTADELRNHAGFLTKVTVDEGQMETAVGANDIKTASIAFENPFIRESKPLGDTGHDRYEQVERSAIGDPDENQIGVVSKRR